MRDLVAPLFQHMPELRYAVYFLLAYIAVWVIELRAKRGTLLYIFAYSLRKIPAVLLAAAAVAGLVWMILQIQTVMGLA